MRRGGKRRRVKHTDELMRQSSKRARDEKGTEREDGRERSRCVLKITRKRIRRRKRKRKRDE